ncbi:MAG: Fe-S-containing protein, partial [Terriglobales bacterium]
SGLHELSENGVLPSSKQEMALIGPIVRNDLFFFVTILALAGMMILFEARRRQPVVAADASKAEIRKAQWSARRERRWAAAVYASSFIFIFLVTAQFIYAKSANALSPATELTFTNHQVHIPVSQVSDDDLHRFQANVNGHEVRFLLYKKPDGKVVSVLDACEICGAVGFYKNGNQIICKNCSAPINTNSVGEAGGCNPIPLKSAEDGSEIVIAESDLAADVKWFKK